MTFQYFKKEEAFPNLNTSVLSLELCAPTKCQAQKQNQKVEFNTIKIEELYFQEGEKQRDNCNAVIDAVSTALGVNFTSNYFVFDQANHLRRLYHCLNNSSTELPITPVKTTSSL